MNQHSALGAGASSKAREESEKEERKNRLMPTLIAWPNEKTPPPPPPPPPTTTTENSSPRRLRDAQSPSPGARLARRRQALQDLGVGRRARSSRRRAPRVHRDAPPLLLLERPFPLLLQSGGPRGLPAARSRHAQVSALHPHPLGERDGEHGEEDPLVPAAAPAVPPSTL